MSQFIKSTGMRDIYNPTFQQIGQYLLKLIWWKEIVVSKEVCG